MLPLLLITRPKAAADRFLNALRHHTETEFIPVIAPMIEIVPQGALPDLQDVEALIFTSANGVAAYKALGGAGLQRAYTVGDATAEAAREMGMEATSAQGDSDALVKMILRAAPTGRLLHLRGKHAVGDVAGRLQAAGLNVEEAEIYEQVAQPLPPSVREMLMAEQPIVVPLFSPRTARLLSKEAGGAPLLVAAMSWNVSDAAGALAPEDMQIAERPDIEAMLICVSDLLHKASLLEARRGEV